jgi:hypothetical protein
MNKLLMKRRAGTPANIKIGVFTYPSLRMAFSAINSGRHTGDIDIQICASTNEIATAVLNASGTGSADYTSVTIYPTVTGKTISGNLSGALIQLNGANNVTIDGRLNQAGAKDLTIENTNTGTACKTIEFINGASSNTVKYNTIKGSSTDYRTATVFIGTSTAAGGNNSNVIEYNDITKAGSNRADVCLTSVGTSGKNNDGNIVRYNNFYDCYSGRTGNHSVYLRDNTSSMTISYNSFYETTTVAATASGTTNTSIVIVNNINTTHTISNNYIGGSSAECGGTWTKTTNNPLYRAIWVFSNSGTVNITNNTIKNFDWTNSANASWYGIFADVAGVTTSGNTIGGAAESIKLTNTTTSGGLIGIQGRGTFSSNTINELWTSNGETLATNVYGIFLTQAAQVNGNTITNLYANSTATGNTQVVAGIWQNTANAFTVYDNTISNLTNNTTRTSAVDNAIVGIYFRGSSTLANNYSARNFIHSFTGAGTGQTHYGIRIAGGDATHYNNIISIGGTTPAFIIGIQDGGGAGDDQNLYFNTVYIHGTPASGTINSVAFYSIGNANVRNYRNNIFVNARSTNGSHYAAAFVYSTNTDLTLDYNDYFVSGTGGVLGYYNGANVTSLPIVPDNDANSLNLDPDFIGTMPSTTDDDYAPQEVLLKDGTPVYATENDALDKDYNLVNRDNTAPTIGAFEI